MSEERGSRIGEYGQELTEQIAFALKCAFAWDNTRDGDAFWRDVRARLIRLSKEGF
jgi:hypothetical protein